MDQPTLRAWWAHRQGLDGSLRGAAAAAVLERAGWARSLGGASPYLTLFSRAGIDRASADRAVADVEIHELPAARGCTYVVPAADYALALTVGAPGAESELRAALRLGVTEAEIDALCEAVVASLAAGPLDPDQIRQATGDASRSLGEAGKKKGVGTTLPLALGRLQAAGTIRRIPASGRLDQQRYRYALWRANPRAGADLDLETAYTELARRFFSWIGPATIDEFRDFSALGVKAARRALEPLELVPLVSGDARLLLPADRDRLRDFVPPASPHYALVGSVDSCVLLRRAVGALLEPGDAPAALFGRHGAGGSLTDLPHHGILDRGRLVGLWDFDPDEGQIVWLSFGGADAALADAVATTETYVREQLGEARAFSLDSATHRASRLAALRAAGAAARA